MSETLNLPARIEELTPQQKGWLQLAQTKKSLFDDLQKGELEIQQLVSNITDDKELSIVQERLKKAKGIAEEKKGQRLHFTNMLKDKLIDPSMEFEKRNDDLISQAAAHELTLRKDAWEKQQATVARDKEVADYKAFITNEWERKATTYRLELAKMISDAYKDCLTAKRPVKEMPAFLDTIRKFMSEIKLVPFKQFDRLLIDDKEAGAIYQAVDKYDPTPDLQTALGDLDSRFKMYAEDLKNSEAAIKKDQEQLKQKESVEQDNLEQTTAINNLTAQATGTVTTPGVKLNRKYKVVEQNDQEWALNVMRCFLNNFSEAIKHLGVKTWGNLKVSQMADAVAKLYTENEKLPSTTGLKFEIVTK